MCDAPAGRGASWADDSNNIIAALDPQTTLSEVPAEGGKAVSISAGGVTPLWSRKGHELFYRTEDQRIMVANYTVKGESFVADKPRVWFGKQLANLGLAANFDLAPDGKRFAVLMPAESPEPREMQSHVKLALNFFDEVRRRVAPPGSAR